MERGLILLIEALSKLLSALFLCCQLLIFSITGSWLCLVTSSFLISFKLALEPALFSWVLEELTKGLESPQNLGGGGLGFGFNKSVLKIFPLLSVLTVTPDIKEWFEYDRA